MVFSIFGKLPATTRHVADRIMRKPKGSSEVITTTTSLKLRKQGNTIKIQNHH